MREVSRRREKILQNACIHVLHPESSGDACSLLVRCPKQEWGVKDRGCLRRGVVSRTGRDVF